MSTCTTRAARLRNARLAAAGLLAAGILAATGAADPAHGAVHREDGAAAVGDLGGAPAAPAITFVSVARHTDLTAGGVRSTEDIVRGGRTIGTNVVTCRFTRHADLCRMAMRLPQGTIVARYVQTGMRGAGVLHVTGGVGAYEHATGSGSWYRYLDRTGTRTAVTLRLG
jgi:hypothetical protein